MDAVRLRAVSGLKVCEIDGVSVVYQGDVNKKQKKSGGASQRPKSWSILPIVARRDDLG